MSRVRLRRWAIPPVIACVLALSACAKSTAVKANPSPSVSTPTVMAFTDRNDGQTVHAGVGRQFSVSLASTYWMFDALPDATVVRSVGNPVVAPSPGCVPGEGCGTVTGIFLATGPGTMAVKAHRRSCGEAMGCTGGAGQFSLTVVVP